MGGLLGGPKIKSNPTPPPTPPEEEKDEESEARLNAAKDAEKDKKRRGRTATRNDLGGLTAGSGIAIQ